MAEAKRYNVLFLCTGNSARSIMAEAILKRLSPTRFAAYSAGSHPTGTVNPYAVELLEKLNHPTVELRSKSMDEYSGEDGPRMDFVFTVCDNAAESCPVWPGQPMTAHWPFPDPAAFDGGEAEKRALFADVYGQIHNRLSIFVSLPFESLDRLPLKKRLDEMASRG